MAKKVFFSSEKNQFNFPFIFNFFSLLAVKDRVKSIKALGSVNFYLCFQFSVYFFKLTKKRLKNLFLNFFKDNFFWLEINKLLETNLIGFSQNFIYEKSTCFHTSFLSILLFELYLFDLDFFLFDISVRFSSFKRIFHTLEKNHSSGLLCLGAIPLIFEKSKFMLLDYKIFSIFQFRSGEVLTYSRTFFSLRYKDHLLLSFMSSKKFLFFIKDKLLVFLRGVIRFEIKKSIISESSLDFLGFKIYSSNNKNFLRPNNLDSKLKILNLKRKLYFRLNLFKKKFFTTFLNRIRIELITTFKKLTIDRSVFVFDSLNYKFWSYFFQLESSRSFRYGGLLFTDDV